MSILAPRAGTYATRRSPQIEQRIFGLCARCLTEPCYTSACTHKAQPHTCTFWLAEDAMWGSQERVNTTRNPRRSTACTHERSANETPHQVRCSSPQHARASRSPPRQHLFMESADRWYSKLKIHYHLKASGRDEHTVVQLTRKQVEEETHIDDARSAPRNSFAKVLCCLPHLPSFLAGQSPGTRPVLVFASAPRRLTSAAALRCASDIRVATTALTS